MSATVPTVHLLNGFMNPHGGSEQETLVLASTIRPIAPVKLWATSSRADPTLRRTHAIERARALPPQFPIGGNMVFLGAHWARNAWMPLARPDRLIYVYNTFHPSVLERVLHRPWYATWPRVELVLISQFQRDRLNIDGVVHPSPIDVQRFTPSDKPRDKTRLVVGRLSRDHPDKHDPRDAALWLALADRGILVRIQGGTCLSAQGLAHPNIELLPEGAFAPEDFLRSLDVFVYRSGRHVETFGRVVLEAMACGVPVVGHRNGGYAEHIESGRNGFLFEEVVEALTHIERLLSEEPLRQRFAAVGRATLESLYSPEMLKNRARFYASEAR